MWLKTKLTKLMFGLAKVFAIAAVLLDSSGLGEQLNITKLTAYVLLFFIAISVIV